jgi:hypothetical protein
MAPSNAQKKALAKAKRGIVASGAMSAKGGFDPAQMHKSREMACPHCERIFKQQDRLKQHIARQHADAVAEKSESESSAVKSKSGASSAKARLIIEERERAKEAAARERREGDPNAKNASTPFTRMSCKFPSTILREFVQKQKEFKSPVFKAKEEKTAAGETAAGGRVNSSFGINTSRIRIKYSIGRRSARRKPRRSTESRSWRWRRSRTRFRCSVSCRRSTRIFLRGAKRWNRNESKTPSDGRSGKKSAWSE